MPARAVRVYACTAPVDMRRGFDGLSALVEQPPSFAPNLAAFSRKCSPCPVHAPSCPDRV